MSFKEAKKKHTNEVVRGLREGDGCLPEADAQVNNSAVVAIHKLHEERGQVWLGKINRYASDKNKPYMWKWDGDQVYNFSCDFAIPAYDEELEKLLRQWDKQPSYTLIAAIQERVDALGGVNLMWS